MSRAAALACLLIAAALTGANVPLGKIIVGHMPVYALLTLRFALATMALYVFTRHEPGRHLRTMTGQELVQVTILGLAGSVLFTVFILEGARRTSGADAGIMTATTPVIAAIAGALVKREQVPLFQIAMIALAAAGILLLQASLPDGRSSQFGMLLLGLGVLCETAFIVVSRDISPAWHPLRLSLAVASVSLAASIPLTLLAGGFDRLDTVPASIWAATVWYALNASIVCTGLWYVGVRHVPAWMAALSTAAMPVGALAVSAVIGAESITAAQLAGALLIMAAIALSALPARRATPPLPPLA